MKIQAKNEAGDGVELVSRIWKGDQQAETQLVERYRRDVKIVIRQGVSDSAIVDDLCQETLWIVLKKIRQGDVREPEKLIGFICSVAKNLIIHYFRHAGRQESLTEAEEV